MCLMEKVAEHKRVVDGFLTIQQHSLIPAP